MTATAHRPGPASAERDRRDLFTGTLTLVRLVLRRDRILLPLWVLLLPLGPIAQAAGIQTLLATAAQREAFAETLRTPALVALYGPLFDSSYGALAVTRAGFATVVLAVVSLMVVIRHTRREEQSGRRELVVAGSVGRHAPLAAAMGTVIAANIVLGALVAVGMISQDLPLTGSFATGTSYAAVGIVFATVGGLAAQLSTGTRGARAIGLAALGIAFVLRVGGDLSARAGGPLGWLSWLSPLGWVQQVRPYAGERWWVLLLAGGFTTVVAAAAFAASSRRDLDGSALPERSVTRAPAAHLDSPLALAWRLQRGTLAAWTVGFVLVGLVLGAAGDSVGDLTASTPALVDVFERLGGQQGVVDAYLSGMLGVLALAASGYAISTALELRSEEIANHAEPILATAVGRLRWAAGHVLIAVGGAAVLMAAAALATGLAYRTATGEGSVVGLLGAGMVQLPAVWLLAAIAVLLFAIAPRAATVSWAALAVTLLLGQVGSVLQLDQSVLNLSPFTHTPKLPGGPMSWTPLLVLLTVAAVLATVGLAGWRRRDLHGA